MMNNQPIIISERISIGISACCMGAPVRYNAKGWDMLKNIGREKTDFKWCPVCPECMAGLGVPRDPIHVTSGNGAMVWTGEAEVKNRRGHKVTEQCKEGALACMAALERAGAIAYIYMEGSPSCGVYRTTLKNQKRGNPPGVFGLILLENNYFLIPSSDLQSPLKWWDWRRRLLTFYWVYKLELTNKNDLYSSWHKIKFICQELDDPWAREMGRILSTVEDCNEAFIADFKKQVMDLLRKPSTTIKITNSLWKNYSHYRKESGKTVLGVNSPEFKRNITAIAKELILMERTAVDEKILFGPSPVIYRDKRQIKEEKIEEKDII